MHFRPLLRVVIGLWLLVGYSTLTSATAAARPTPTIKACHICEEEAVTPTPTPEPVVHFWLFYDTYCASCVRVLDDVLPQILSRYETGQVVVHGWDLARSDSETRHALEKQHGLDSGEIPQVFIGDQVLLGEEEIQERLGLLIDRYLAQGGVALPQVTPLPSPTLDAGTPTPAPAELKPAPASKKPVVRAVMFWMNGCPHCHEVIDHVLPPLKEKYGDQLDIRLIEVVTQQDVDRLFQTAAAFGIPNEQVGVPFLLIGDRALIGSLQIPAELPGLIEQHLAAGGVDYPDVPGLDLVPPTLTPNVTIHVPAEPSVEATAQAQATTTPVVIAEVVAAPPPVASPTTQPRPSGFTLAIGVMVGMVAALVYTSGAVAGGFQGLLPRPVPGWLELAVPLLALTGLGVAGYLAYVETQAVPAICGPVGDCNAVQSSPYARLFGVLPVGVLGAVGYLAILAVWLWGRLRADWLARYAPLAVFGMALFGTLFSLYLTYLEPFVIRAVCAWCLTSAVIMTLLMVLSIGPALQAIRVTRDDD